METSSGTSIYKGKGHVTIVKISVQRVTYSEGFQAAFCHEYAGRMKINGTKAGRVRTGTVIGIGAITTKDCDFVSVRGGKTRDSEARR